MFLLTPLKTLSSTLIRRVVSTPLLLHTFARGYKITAGELKKGLYIDRGGGKIYEVLKCEHQKVAMRGGFMIVEMRNVFDGTKGNDKMRTAEGVEIVEIESGKYTYQGISEDNKSLLFENDEGETKEVSKDKLKGLEAYLEEEEDEVTIVYYEDRIVEVILPKEVVVTIENTPEKVSGSWKTATLENGRVIKVPPHIENGTRVIIRLPDEAFLERYRE
eukprot:TRINITY_DN6350_c0_g7_i2.p1 TRINITY_DN6350_c0_g7~~TRINITY_DN6350_c0_g7_i2.p1  ORF type:complete len:218 (-),score=32.48 TRINITY_DN6350_c0_g7_i2:153-806(-)